MNRQVERLMRQLAEKELGKLSGRQWVRVRKVFVRQMKRDARAA